jgi:hypothetical protein
VQPCAGRGSDEGAPFIQNGRMARERVCVPPRHT